MGPYIERQPGHASPGASGQRRQVHVAPGRVVLRAASASNEVMLEVEDTSIGISDRDLPRIFDRFYRAHGSRSGGGAVPGLSIAQWIVQGRNGRIEVRSSPGN